MIRTWGNGESASMTNVLRGLFVWDQVPCQVCSMGHFHFYLNHEGLLCLGLQTLEALLDLGSKVT